MNLFSDTLCNKGDSSSQQIIPCVIHCIPKYNAIKLKFRHKSNADCYIWISFYIDQIALQSVVLVFIISHCYRFKLRKTLLKIMLLSCKLFIWKTFYFLAKNPLLWCNHQNYFLEGILDGLYYNRKQSFRWKLGVF